jgi:alpha-L-fucosidase 2
MIKQAMLLAASAALMFAQHPMDAYNVVWNSPGKDSSGSMPLGNGDVGLNVWTEENGDILFYVAKSDAWSENGQLLKLGRVRLRLNPNPFAGSQQFRQTLNIRTGEVTIQGGNPGSQAKIAIWVDAMNPVIRVETDLEKAADLQVMYERWRNQPRVLEGAELDSAYGMDGGPEPLRSMGDTIALDVEDSIVWYHRNPKSPVTNILKHQGLLEAMASMGDPLANHTFGALIHGEGLSRTNATTLRTKAPARQHAIQVFAHSKAAGSTEEWLLQLRNLVSRISSMKIEDRRSAHEKYWSDFWDRSYIRITGGPNAQAVSQAYALQRFLNACAGRGALPIKANGSLFTVDAKVDDMSYDADFRPRGGAYWLRSTSLVYWPMLASGDSDLMQPFFNMYRDALPVAQRRVKAYFNHDGAYFPEIMYSWGSYTNADYGWNREGKVPSFVQNAAIRSDFTSNLELLAMGLDYADYFPADRLFAKQMLAPLADSLLVFFDSRFERDPNGKIRITPAQALGAYHEAVNPLPDIAGIRYVANRVLAEKIPVTKAGQNAAKRLLQQLPELPVRDVAGKKVLVPAEKVFGEPKTTDNPELHAVFPFRLFGVEKQDLETGKATFDARKNKRTGGMQTDAIQAAHLGLASVARQYVVESFTAKPAARFPAFWGPNDGSTPDQTHGAVASMALQSMLLQAEGDRIFLAPAWPKDWDVEFKLSAPQGTVVEGTIKAGTIERVKTTPDKRQSDISRMELQ